MFYIRTSTNKHDPKRGAKGAVPMKSLTDASTIADSMRAAGLHAEVCVHTRDTYGRGVMLSLDCVRDLVTEMNVCDTVAKAA